MREKAMKKKYLLFDIDGTLINAGGAGRRALNDALTGIGLNSAVLQGISFAGKTDRQIVLSALRGAGYSNGRLPVLLAEVLESYLRHLQSHLNASATIRVYPLVKELLQACMEREDIELALLSGNIPAGARLKLEAAGLWNFFTWGIFGDHSESRVELAREALRRLKARDHSLHTRDIFVIGDTSADIDCGRAIQATTIGMISDYEPAEKLKAAAPDYLLAGYLPLFELWKLPAPGNTPSLNI
jgi:phosphoglycolate phosphatase-like HAD superfamily hydrolase